MSTYIVKSQLKHNGTLYNKGDEIELEGEVAERLEAGRVVVAKDSEEGVEEPERRNPQPPVNVAKRENDDVDSPVEVEEGKDPIRQPGEEVEEGEDGDESNGEGESEEGDEEKKEEGSDNL